MNRKRWESLKSEYKQDDEEKDKIQDEIQDLDQFIPMKGKKSLRKKIERTVEKRDEKKQFIVFNDFDVPINKIGKEILPFDVVLNYFKKLHENQPNKAIDVNSKNGIWGSLLAKTCEKTDVDVLIDRDNRKTLKNTIRLIDTNNIPNIEIIDQNELEQIIKNGPVFNLAIFEQVWGINSVSAYNEISKIWNLLNINGNLIIVTHKNRGISSLIKILEEHDIQSEIVGRGRGGVRLIRLTKISEKIINPIETKRRIQFEFDNKSYEATTDNNIFSGEGLDEGTKFLMNTVIKNEEGINGKKIGDFGAGWGAISIIIADLFPETNLLAIEKNPTAYKILQENLKDLINTKTLRIDLADKESKEIKSQSEQLDYIISNPPFHVSEKEQETIFMNAKKLLKKGGVLIFVVEKSFSNKFKETANRYFSLDKEFEEGKYIVLRYQK